MSIVIPQRMCITCNRRPKRCPIHGTSSCRHRASGKARCIFGSSDGNVYALDAVTGGGLRWKSQTEDVVHSSPAIADGTLYIGRWDKFLYALGAATGQEKWRFKTEDDPEYHNHVGIQSSPMVADGVVYFGSRDSYAYAVEAATGKQIWKFSTGGSWVNNSSVVRDGQVYFGTSVPGLCMLSRPKPARSFSMCRTFPTTT